MGTLSRLFLTLSLRRVGRELCASADRIRVAGIDNYFVCRLSSLDVVSTAILRACTGFYAWARSGWFIRLLARVADRTSHGVTDDDNLRRICSAEAATFTIRRVLADFYALKCSGWPTPMPRLQWHVPPLLLNLPRDGYKGDLRAQPHLPQSRHLFRLQNSSERFGIICGRD